MGNCITSPGDMKKRQFVDSKMQKTLYQESKADTEKTFKMNARNEERRRLEMMTEDEKIIEMRRRREENETKKQLYNFEKLRTTLNTDMETFLLNNILFSVQFFENFERDRSSFSSLRLKEQSRINAEGPGGGLSSSRHRKRASLPDTMQETVGRWVRLDPPILNSPTFPAKKQRTHQRSRSSINLLSSSERLDMCKELLAPLRIMVVHEDVRVVEKEGEELYRAVIPEPSPMSGYVILRCVGSWEEDPSNEIYATTREKEVVPELGTSEEAEYSPYSEYSGSEKFRESESEYSYSCKKLYDKSIKIKDEYTIEENGSTNSSDHSDDEGPDTFDLTLTAGVKSLGDIKKKKIAASISQRPPMLPPQDHSMNPSPHEFGPKNPGSEENNVQHFGGRRDSGTVNNLHSWHSISSANTSRSHNHALKPGDATSNKEVDNWKLGKTSNFGNIHKGFNHSPKPSISTENSDSDYGYATIPPSYTPQSTPKRHGGIPLQCLTKVRYRRIEGEEDEEAEELDLEGEQLARRIEGKTANIEHLFTTKTFLNPSEFLKAFDEEVRWRENSDSSLSNVTTNSSNKNGLELPPDLEHVNPVKRRRSYKNGSIDKVSVDSGNGTEDDDNSLQARLGIPSSIPVDYKGASWYSQRDRCGMRFPIEIIPSITIPWPTGATVDWLHRKRKTVVEDMRTGERRHAWPGRLVLEASRTDCHAIAPLNQLTGYDSIETLKTKHLTDSLGWKLCFCEAERVLEEGLTHAQTRCLLFALLLRRCYLQWDSVGLSHNFVRVAFYWQCERGRINWPEEEMGNNLRAVLSAMYTALSRGKLADYFIRKKDVAAEESEMTKRRAQAALHSMTDTLSIHAARAISGLRFSDSRVPTLDFKRLIQILTDESIWKTLNPALFMLTLSRDSDSEDEGTDRPTENSNPGPSGSSQKEVRKKSRITPAALNSAIRKKFEKENSKPDSSEMFTEFSRVGTRYKINPGEIRSNPDEIKPYPDEQFSDELQDTIKQKISKVKIVKGTGTINAKKTNPRLEASDAFARLKKADKEREWTAMYRRELETAKQKKEMKDEPENADIFAKAETYKPHEVSANPERRRLLLSLFAKHFAHLGRRCGRDWGAFRVADSYLRHAENLTKLLEEHEGGGYNDDGDDDENRGEAKTIMNEIRKEFDILTTLRTAKFHKNAKNIESGRLKYAIHSTSTQSNWGSSMPDLSRQGLEKTNTAKLGSMKSLKENKNQNENNRAKSELYLTDEEDARL